MIPMLQREVTRYLSVVIKIYIFSDLECNLNQTELKNKILNMETFA